MNPINKTGKDGLGYQIFNMGENRFRVCPPSTATQKTAYHKGNEFDALVKNSIITFEGDVSVSVDTLEEIKGWLRETN